MELQSQVLVGCTADFGAQSLIHKQILGVAISFMRVDDRIYAFRSRCPHMDFGLEEAVVEGRAELVCPFHLGRFDVANGGCAIGGPPKRAGKHLQLFDVIVAGNDLFLSDEDIARMDELF